MSEAEATQSNGAGAAADAEATLAQLESADADQLASLAGQIPDEQLAEALQDAGNRKRVLGEVFRRMSDHVEAERIEGVDAIVHFRITDPSGDGVDIHEVRFAGGECKVSDEASTEEPTVSLQMDPVTFLRLATGSESGPALFMTGKLKIKGDLMFASRVATFFRIPGAA